MGILKLLHGWWDPQISATVLYTIVHCYYIYNSPKMGEPLPLLNVPAYSADVR